MSEIRDLLDGAAASGETVRLHLRHPAGHRLEPFRARIEQVQHASVLHTPLASDGRDLDPRWVDADEIERVDGAQLTAHDDPTEHVTRLVVALDSIEQARATAGVVLRRADGTWKTYIGTIDHVYMVPDGRWFVTIDDCPYAISDLTDVFRVVPDAPTITPSALADLVEVLP